MGTGSNKEEHTGRTLSTQRRALKAEGPRTLPPKEATLGHRAVQGGILQNLGAGNINREVCFCIYV